jgi:hypothetical protein
MYFSTPFSIVLLAGAATVFAAPYTNATIHVRAQNTTLEGRAPHSNSTLQARGSNATIASAPLVTPAARRNVDPLHRRKAQAPATR